MLKNQKKARIKYTVVVEIDEDKETEDFHNSLSSSMVELLNRNGCIFVVGKTNEVVTVTRLDKLQ